MNYFTRQWKLLKDSYLLVLLFLLCATAMILTMNLIFYYVYTLIFSFWSFSYLNAVSATPWRAQAILTLLIIASMSIVYYAKMLLLNSGGDHIAEYYGGIRIDQPNDYYTTRYQNIVEELAIASRMPVPNIFVIPKNENINAFVAGISPEDAAVCISYGALTKLNRDELQAVLAHEFSHIVHHDMRLNMQLIALQSSINWISESLWIINTENYDNPTQMIMMPLIPFVIMFLPVSVIGNIFATLLKLGVNRKREFLADASAVHYTRLSIGLIGALKKIASTSNLTQKKAGDLQSISHMMFDSVSPLKSILSSHPSIVDRIKAIDPGFDDKELASLKNYYQKFSPNGMEEDRALGFYSGGNDEATANPHTVAMPAYKISSPTGAATKIVATESTTTKIIVTVALLLLSAILLKGGLFFYHEMTAIPDQPPGILVSDEPQFNDTELTEPFYLKDFLLTTLGSYSITGRVLVAKQYSSDSLSAISPADFLLGWGMMSDTTVLKSMRRIMIADRFYSYFHSGYADAEEMQNYIAMTVLIPANNDVAYKIMKVKKNNIVTLSGYVVNVTTPKGIIWRSKTKVDKQSRHGMYIILWVNEIYIH